MLKARVGLEGFSFANSRRKLILLLYYLILMYNCQLWLGLGLRYRLLNILSLNVIYLVLQTAIGILQEFFTMLIRFNDTRLLI